jgi:tetratricopeptide (TPR) repeat protein
MAMKRFTLSVSALLLILFTPLLARAHADLLALIDGVSKRIEGDPKNALHYFLRAELYRAHADWKLAEADYVRAAQLNPKLAEVELGRGKLFFESGRDAEAKAILDKYLVNHGDDVDGRITRAQLLTKLGDRQGAAADYTHAISHCATPRADYFLERAKLQVELGDLAAALKGLDDGLARLGPLVALQLYAIDLECFRQKFDDALRRLDVVAATSDRKEKWLARRGEILLQANRSEEARAAFADALAAIESLPLRLRTAPATVELKSRINQVTTAETPLKL